jgi:hypothetical protein
MACDEVLCAIVIDRPTRISGLQLSPAEPLAGGRHTCDGVLPGAPKESFATLLSPPQFYAAFGTTLITLASRDHSLVCSPRTLPPTVTRTPSVAFWEFN